MHGCVIFRSANVNRNLFQTALFGGIPCPIARLHQSPQLSVTMRNKPYTDRRAHSTQNQKSVAHNERWRNHKANAACQNRRARRHTMTAS